jgi:hypothetical protein
VTGAEVRLFLLFLPLWLMPSFQDVGGIQIDVFPKYDTMIEFKRRGRDINIYKTARQLGLGVGNSIQMIPFDPYRSD